MSRGLMRLKILSVNIYQDWHYPTNNMLILGNGGQMSEILLPATGGEQIWMEYLSDSLQLTLINKSDPYAQEFGYADIRNTLHKINVYVSIKDKRKGWADKDAALIILELYYSKQPIFSGNLGLLILDADLIRDTQFVGKMDPYVVIRTAKGDFSTTIKNNAGKRPQWGQQFNLSITGINQRIELIVYDKDVMTDDEVGRCTFTVRELGFSQRDQIKPLNLTYLKKKGTIPEQAGMIRIKAILN